MKACMCGLVALAIGWGNAPVVVAQELGAPGTPGVPTAPDPAGLDLQPGMNFPVAIPQFGGSSSENIDVGDVDLDGDLDVVVANGGNGGKQLNRIYINRGGLQGGTPGTFIDETAARFADMPLDQSRDIEFADIDNDGDLDLHVSNTSSQLGGGGVSRWYVNLGGVQGGELGYFRDETESRWGQLVSVRPMDEEGVQDGVGPWRDYSCDCDFGDLDNDGDLDLFHASYGPNINGIAYSRIFLNDGEGRFDELWPWTEKLSDIQLHTIDVDLADFDGDFDLDIFASSRDSQARVYVNNTYQPIGQTAFTDVTAETLGQTGALGMAVGNYEAEIGDVDGDGDFDVWALNYSGAYPGNQDRILRNETVGGNGPRFAFTSMSSWIRGDPEAAENEIDFVDYDSDGDLDAFVANFDGSSWLYTNTRMQGMMMHAGLFHRTGTHDAGSQAPAPEIPLDVGYFSLDGQVGDLDNDGDPDLLLANDAYEPNRMLLNQLGVPDTHAPDIHMMELQCNKPEGVSTPLQMQVRDNAPHYLIALYEAMLVYSVNSGPDITLRMTSQGGQQFRGVIPPLKGMVSYRMEITDLAGNRAVSSTHVFRQSGSTWTDLGSALGGPSGAPMLWGSGTWAGGTPGSLTLTNGPPLAHAAIHFSLVAQPQPAFGGMMIPSADLVPITHMLTAEGRLEIPIPSFPHTIPCGVTIYMQALVQDPGAPAGIALSNAVAVRTP